MANTSLLLWAGVCTRQGRIASDLMAIGNWSSRADVLENGVKPIIRKVQDPQGYTAYNQYEGDMRRVVSRVQKAVSFEVEKGRRGKSEELIKVACGEKGRKNRTVWARVLGSRC